MDERLRSTATEAAMWMVVLAGCVSPTGESDKIELDPGPDPGSDPIFSTDIDTLLAAEDVGVSSGYEDKFFGQYQRGRAAVVLDFDGDGKLDEFSGNPGDTSYFLRNVSTGPGHFAFEPGQIVATDEDFLAYWGGAAADYDNDGDQDVYVAYGGNDTTGFDRILRNDLQPNRSNAASPFVEIDDEAGIGFVTPLGVAKVTASMGTVWVDLDLDGLLDLYVATELPLFQVGDVTLDDGTGLEQIYRNQGDGTFRDVAVEAGMTHQRSSRNPSTLDYDADGDMDLFELSFIGGSVVWRNEYLQTGRLEFTDVTQEVSLGGGNIEYPTVSSAFCSLAADLNNDGWDDLVVFRRGQKDEPDEPKVHDIGHLLWINVEGRGFVEVAGYTELNNTFLFRDHDTGVMGCQTGDLDVDGFPDLVVGNGSPDAGAVQQLYVSSHRTDVDIPGVGTVRVPHFDDVSYLIAIAGADSDYPYRHHGQAIADYDGDGFPELGAHNGGPMLLQTDEEMQEPNQLFAFTRSEGLHYLRVRLQGDGIAVNRDGIGAKVHLHVARDEEPDLYLVRYAGTGFASQNDPVLFFGLLQSTVVDYVEVTWTDGTVTRVDQPTIDQTLTIAYRSGG